MGRGGGRTVIAVACAAAVLSGCSTASDPAPPAAAASTTASAPVPAAVPAPMAAPAAPAASCTVPRTLVGKDVTRLPVTGKVVALTFDAGANADAVPSVLATLAAKGVPATFFLTGTFVQAFPRKSATIGARYVVGNHTMTHRDLTTVSDLRVRRQVRNAQAAILAATGQDPRRFFRFPFGARNAHLIAVLNGLCYVPFRWTVDSLGWKGTSGGMTVTAVADRVVAAATPGEIVLMHVGSNPDDGTMLDAAALPAVIDRLRAKGYTFVRLSRVMSAAP